ncbi:MAG: hypothetical protein EB127_18130 [Alphaproteobacteria bacterium]|nr:hypothetical protein [Alphaproteobacteria bacterium]
MNEDYYYYKERCQELEAQLADAQKIIDALRKKLYDIQVAVRTRNIYDAPEVLSTIAYLAYDWNKK